MSSKLSQITRYHRGHAAVARRAVTAAAATEPDPTFALIEAFEQAYIAHGTAINAEAAFCVSHRRSDGSFPKAGDWPELQVLEDRVGQACDAQWEANLKLFLTPPGTMAGLAALLKFVITRAERDCVLSAIIPADDHDDGDGPHTILMPLFRTLSESVDEGHGLAPSSPAVYA
jgi:hypothetical protein